MKPFSILDHLDKLTVVKDLPTEIHCNCPVCGAGGFKITKGTGKYFTFACDCMDSLAGKKAVLEAIYPQSDRPALSSQKHLRPKQFRTFNYRDRLGNQALSVSRIDHGNGQRKTIKREPVGCDTKALLPYLSERLELSATTNRIPSLFISEGEPKTETLIELFANCVATNGVGGKWIPENTDYVVGLGYRDIILCPDKDTTGLANMIKVAKQFLSHSITCHWLLPDIESWQDLPAKDGVDVVDWVADGAIAEDFLSWTILADDLPDWLKEKIAPTLPRGRWDPPDTIAWLDQESSDSNFWLIDTFLSLGSNMLVGKSGQGKSILATQMAISVATGQDFLGRKVNQGVVLYHTSDEPEKLLKHRLNTQELRKHPLAHNFKPLIKDIEGNRWSINYLDGLEEQIKKLKPKLFVVDSLRSAIAQPQGLKETDEEIGQSINALKEICEHYDVSLLLVHHQRKNGEGDALDSVCGHNSISSPLDCIWAIKPDMSRGKDARRLTLIKSRIGEDLQEVYLMLDTYSLTYNAPRPHNAPEIIHPETVDTPAAVVEEKVESPDPETLTIKKRIEQWFIAWDCPKPIDPLVEYLSATKVSKNSIRKYLNELVKEGILKIVPASIPKLYTLGDSQNKQPHSM